MIKIPTLKPGDRVELVAPASRCSDPLLNDLKQLLLSWQLDCIVANDIFGDDLLCANSDEFRFKSLKNAIQNPTTKGIICARGGYGSMRLIPELAKMSPPQSPKLFVGMSDITALNIFLFQQWGWPSLHGALALDKFSLESITTLKSVIFGENTQLEYVGTPLNAAAKQNRFLDTSIMGGNLSLIQASIGTSWQLKSKDKIIFLEEVSERGYRIDRMLEHLRQADIFKDATAILFGDFIKGQEPDGSSLVKPVLKRFAEQCEIPVVQVQKLGHGYTNFPLPLGTAAKIELGKEIKLTCFT